MYTHRFLASVAQLEFRVLMQDTRRAIQGLERQRQSAIQAIQAAQRANERAASQPLDTVMVEIELVDKLRCLEAALDQVISEIEEAAACPDVAPADPGQPSFVAGYLLPVGAWPVSSET